MLRVCMAYLKENKKSWKIEEEERMTLKKRKEEKNRKMVELKNNKEEKDLQKRITETWKRIPEHEKRHLVKLEEKRKRFELREAKLNIWKKWRKEEENTKMEVMKTNREQKEDWLKKLEELEGKKYSCDSYDYPATEIGL